MKNLKKIAIKINSIKITIKEFDFLYFGKDMPKNIRLEYCKLKKNKKKLTKKILKTLTNEK
jgi:hypothetical protein